MDHLASDGNCRLDRKVSTNDRIVTKLEKYMVLFSTMQVISNDLVQFYKVFWLAAII